MHKIQGEAYTENKKVDKNPVPLVIVLQTVESRPSLA